MFAVPQPEPRRPLRLRAPLARTPRAPPPTCARAPPLAAGIFGARALLKAPGAKYIGVEPAPPTFKALQANLLGAGGDGAGSFFEMNPAYGACLRPPYPGARATRVRGRTGRRHARPPACARFPGGRGAGEAPSRRVLTPSPTSLSYDTPSRLPPPPPPTHRGQQT
jgi:hypothetical protein